MIKKDPYSTTFGRIQDTSNIVKNIKEAIISQEIDLCSLKVIPFGDIVPVFLTGYFPMEESIPLFTHPITIYNFRNKTYLVTDLRLTVKKDGLDYGDVEKNVRDLVLFNFHKSRAILSQRWLAHEQESIFNNTKFASLVYSQWLSTIIGNAYGLDNAVKKIIAIIASVFYYFQFQEESEINDKNLELVTIHTINSAIADNNMVNTYISMMSNGMKFRNIDDLCSAIVHVTDNVRLKNLNVAVLLTLIKNSWNANNGSHILSVGLEHPPTWISIVYACLSEKSYKKMVLTTIAERFLTKESGDTFIKNFRSMMSEHISFESLEDTLLNKAFKDLEEDPAFQIS